MCDQAGFSLTNTCPIGFTSASESRQPRRRRTSCGLAVSRLKSGEPQRPQKDPEPARR